MTDKRKIEFMKEAISHEEKIQRYQRQLEDLSRFEEYPEKEKADKWIQLSYNRFQFQFEPSNQFIEIFIETAKTELKKALTLETEKLVQKLCNIEIKL